MALGKIRLALWATIAVAIIILSLKYNTITSKSLAPTAMGEVAIGGPFSLVKPDGTPVTESAFAGRYMLVYFGFTFCPDICPTDLLEFGAVLNQLGETKSARVAALFITVDPQRDTPEQLQSYAQNFDPRITFLTGTQDQVAAAAKAYKVYYMKRGKPGDEEHYLIDHSAFMYLMGPDGKYITHFTHEQTADEIAKKVEGIVK